MEEWRAIPQYDGYEVSNLGNVRSWWQQISRGIGNGKGTGGRIIGTTFKIQKQHIDSDGYCITSATGNDGKHKSLKVHRLVAMAFIPNPNGYPMVNHKDENKQNNNVSNLEWCDAKYNDNYGSRNKRMALPRRKTVAKYDLDGNYIETFESMSEATRRTGIKHIVCACNGKRKQAGGFQWRYSESKMNIAPIEGKTSNESRDIYNSGRREGNQVA